MSASISSLLSIIIRNNGSGPIGGGNGMTAAIEPTLAVLLLTKPPAGAVNLLLAGGCGIPAAPATPVPGAKAAVARRVILART